MIDLTSEGNLKIMVQVMSDPNLHIMVSRGYKDTGTTVAFDGSEDGEMTGDAREAWVRLGMRAKIDAAVKEVKRKWCHKEITWDYDTVRYFVRKDPQQMSSM